MPSNFARFASGGPLLVGGVGLSVLACVGKPPTAPPIGEEGPVAARTVGEREAGNPAAAALPETDPVLALLLRELGTLDGGDRFVGEILHHVKSTAERSEPEGGLR